MKKTKVERINNMRKAIALLFVISSIIGVIFCVSKAVSNPTNSSKTSSYSNYSSSYGSSSYGGSSYSSATKKDPAVGMTMDEVLASSWGAPKMKKTRNADDFWYYGENLDKCITFSHGIVAVILG